MNYLLTVKGTVDQIISKIMVEKDATQNKVFDELKRLANQSQQS